MDNSNQLPEHWQQMFVEMEQEFEGILVQLKTREANIEGSENIDIDLLEKVIFYHIRNTQESLIALSKLIYYYNHAGLNDKVILALAQWT